MTPGSAESTAADAASARRPEPAAAVIFDADGVLVDTEPAWAAARRTLYERYGSQFGEAQHLQTLGTGLAGTSRALSALLGAPHRTGELSDELLSLLLAEVSEHPPQRLPGALEPVDELRGRLPIAVASNSPRALLDRSLHAARLAGLFDVVLGVDEVAHAKPAPDLYLTAMKRLGSSPSQTVALEDSPAGATAARGAGLYVIGIRSHTHISLDVDQVVDSLSDARLRAQLGLPVGRGAG